MKVRGRLVAIVAIVVLLCTACTGGGWFGSGNVDFPTDGIDSDRASERRETTLFDDIVTRGDEVIVVNGISQPGFSGDRLQYSANAGRSWDEVLFDGRPDPGIPIYYLAAREGQWMALGWFNQQAIPFTSKDGRDFTRHGSPAFDWPTGLQGELLGTPDGWVFVGVETPNGNPSLARLHTSSDGANWTRQDPLLAGLPAVGNGFRITDAAAGGGTVVVAGQVQGGRVSAQAYASSDAGKSWRSISPDASGVGYYNNGFRTVQWTGTEFRLTGFAWPKPAGQLVNPLGMAASWGPGQEWKLDLDESWADPNRDFPWTPSIAYRPSAALAIQEIGDAPTGSKRLLHQAPGKSWGSPPALPEPDPGEIRLYDETAAVGDGFLVTTAVTKHGNNRRSIVHVADDGTVTDRTPPGAPGAEPRKPGLGSFVTRNGITSAFGTIGSEALIWTMDSERKVSGYGPLEPTGRDTLSSMHGGPKGLMLLGSSRNEDHVNPVIWSKADGGEWAASNSLAFGSGPSGSRSPVSAGLPQRMVSSRPDRTTPATPPTQGLPSPRTERRGTRYGLRSSQVRRRKTGPSPASRKPRPRPYWRADTSIPAGRRRRLSGPRPTHSRGRRYDLRSRKVSKAAQ